MAADLSRFKKEYTAAVALIKADQWEEGIAAAQENLADIYIPRYWRMKNMLLVAAALDDWYPAERMRLEIEGWWKHTERLCDPNDDEDRAAMANIRVGLDELQAILKSQAPDPVDQDRIRDGSGDEVDEDGDDAENDDSVSADCVEADATVLPSALVTLADSQLATSATLDDALAIMGSPAEDPTYHIASNELMDRLCINRSGMANSVKPPHTLVHHPWLILATISVQRWE
ncbi:hypothetical protein LTR95_009538 [Oleoguttula sp. CCFEE 5521]